MKRIAPQIKYLAACVAVLLAAGTNSALAQDKAGGAAAMTQACKADIQKLCTSVKPGGGRMAECLKQHEAELSPTCKSQLGGLAECGQQVKKVCGSDVVERSAQQACVKSHASEFSAACRSAIAGQ